MVMFGFAPNPSGGQTHLTHTLLLSGNATSRLAHWAFVAWETEMVRGDKDASCMRMCMQYNVKWTRLAKVASCHNLRPRVCLSRAGALQVI